MQRRFGRLLSIAALSGLGLLAAAATPAQAATVSLYAASTAAGTSDCSSPANACTIATAVTNANAASVADSVRIALASGTYPLPSPSQTALVITFAGPSLTLEAESGTPVLDGMTTVRLLSVGATSNVTIDGLEIRSGKTAGLGLQPTKTALLPPAAAVEQNAPVTLTATVTPAANGGTMSFNDGAGNPATAHCAAQSVANGTATCTVSYASLGSYAVTATYAGDGAMNNYVGSASTTQTVGVVPGPPVVDVPVLAAPDRAPPTSRTRRLATVKQPITLRGSATDAGPIRRVRVSMARHVGKLCQFLRADRTFSRARNCDKQSYLDAKGTSSWSLKLPSLPHGRYAIWTRGINAAGNVERKNRKRNLLVVRIPRR